MCCFFINCPQLGHTLVMPHMGRRAVSATLQAPNQAAMTAREVCARTEASTQLSAGHLQPLPIPRRPWSHIQLDFVTGIPSVNSLNTILTMSSHYLFLYQSLPLLSLSWLSSPPPRDRGGPPCLPCFAAQASHHLPV